MSTSTISSTITDATGAAVVGARVVCRLVPAPAFRTANGSEIDPVVETVTDSSGNWSLVLEETASISPSNTNYEVVEYLPSGPRKHTIQVGASDQSLFAALVTPPPAADGNTYLTQASADARYQQVGALGGAAVAVDHSAASNGVSAAAARVDHKHALASGFRIPIVCTSATRPGSPSEGDLIYETDTDKVLVRISTSWVPIGNQQIVTSATRPATTFEGLMIYETDTDSLLIHSGSAWEYVEQIGAWSSYTSFVVSQSATPTTSAKTGRFRRDGRRTVHFQWEMTFSSAGTASNEIRLGTLPVAPHATQSPCVGAFRYFDAGTTVHAGSVMLDGPNARLTFCYDGFGSNMGAGDFAIANTDTFHGFAIYEAAS